MVRIPVFYREEMVADASSFSPSPSKPRWTVQDWRDAGLPIEIRPFEPVSADTLKLAHDARFVDDVLGLRLDNGFGNTSPQVAKSLPYTSGAMLAAAQEAVINKTVAVAPVSGFHHAGYASAEGYCTFNGLMVTAMALREEGFARRVGILDLDQHYGNGTDDIIERLGLGFIEHFTAGNRYRQVSQAEPFLSALPQVVERFEGCDVLLYQAGADPHVDDPLGGWLTTEQLERRDRFVFETAARIRLPVAWNLAGGYQRTSTGSIEPVLRIHRNTMRQCARVYAGLGQYTGNAALT